MTNNRDSEVEAVVREYGGQIPEELARLIAAFRQVGDDVVDEDDPDAR